ncbi:MAG TPA: hypothetical protein VGK34_02805, partial [Armatimonadota bacterium]
MAIQVGQPQTGLMSILSAMMADEGAIGMLGGGSSASPSTENVQQVVKKFLEKDKNNELVARIVYPKMAPSIAGEKFTSLPPSIADAMKSPRATALGTDKEEIKDVVPTDWVISGSQRLMITVRKLNAAEKKSPQRETPEMPSIPAPPSSSSGTPSLMDEGDDYDDSMTTTAIDTFTLEEEESDISEGLSESSDVEVKADSGKPGSSESQKPGEEAKKEEAQPSEKAVVRASSTWKQTSKADFQTGKLTNAIATSKDSIWASTYIKPLYESPESYVWCVLPDGKGNVYAGTGNHGIVYRITKDGQASEFYKSPELEINSLAMDAAGNIYAGTSPHGIIYKIDPQGKAEKFYAANDKYITAMTFDSKGILYAAAGDSCKVYRIAGDQKASAVLETADNSALCLAADKNDNIFVGTGLNGVVYKISPSGAISAVYDAVEDSVTALAINSKGALYIGTHPKGVIYKLSPDATPKVVYDKAGTGITGITIDDHDNVYAVNSANIFKILPDDTVGVFDNKDELQFLCSYLKNGRLYAGVGNVGAVYQADLTSPAEGIFESVAHDCGSTSQWGSIEWTSDVLKSGTIAFQTRTGNSAVPDVTWSAWSPTINTPGSKITSLPARFLQYRAIITNENSFASPALNDITVTYLPANQSPKVSFTNPKGGEKWSKKQTIKWTGTDPDKDTLIYDTFYSADNGATWAHFEDKPAADTKPGIEAAAKGKTSTAEKPSFVQMTPAEAQKIIDEIKADLANHPEIPADIKDQIIADSPAVAGTPKDNTSSAQDK